MKKGKAKIRKPTASQVNEFGALCGVISLMALFSIALIAVLLYVFLQFTFTVIKLVTPLFNALTLVHPVASVVFCVLVAVVVYACVMVANRMLISMAFKGLFTVMRRKMPKHSACIGYLEEAVG